MMNPDENRFEAIHDEKTLEQIRGAMERMESSPALEKRSRITKKPVKFDTFYIGEIVTIKSYMYRVKKIEQDEIVFEPYGPVVKYRKKNDNGFSNKKDNQ